MERIKRSKFCWNLREFIWESVRKTKFFEFFFFLIFCFRLISILIDSSVKLSFSRILVLNFSFHLISIESSLKLSFNRILGLNFYLLFN